MVCVGSKIKALRNKTKTYIRTPVRGEKPIFVVTGRKEDVKAAKSEIVSAADHFSQLRAERRSGGSHPVNHSGENICLQVRVPYRAVGLVVGPKGATVKRIQAETGTYIVTPSKEREPIFDIWGPPNRVQWARAEIEAHIAAHTSLPPEERDEGIGESPPPPTILSRRRGSDQSKDCMCCYESRVVAALLPCGHNQFCLECANRAVNNAECPICKKCVTTAVRIVS